MIGEGDCGAVGEDWQGLILKESLKKPQGNK
jgi:hypothetical protein